MAAADVDRLQMGTKAHATDGPVGELTAVVVDPVAQAATHIIITPPHHPGLGHLVPLELVESEGDPIQLRLTVAEFRRLDSAEDDQVLRVSGGKWAAAHGRTFTFPYYRLASLAGGSAGSAAREVQPGYHYLSPDDMSDRVPLGEVEVRRGDEVHAVDGWIGSVEGLVIDPADHHVTHVLLAEGHLWSHKQVAIPITKASRVGDSIRVELTKEQIEQLPPVGLD
jgi:sporulation protein YlmC with PRC-barrel domain